MNQEFYSNGKLLLSGEYAILDGALGLAIPTKFGQSLHVAPNDSDILEWKSFDHKGDIWFSACFDLLRQEEIQTSDHEIYKTLSKILAETRNLNPSFLIDSKGCLVRTELTFPKNWGLGSSSTLINNIAQWANVDAHQLLWNTMGGSGYDISCAQENQPLLYRLEDGTPKTEKVVFDPDFKEGLFFIHLNQKQNSREAIANYRAQNFDADSVISSLSKITEEMLHAKDLKPFEEAIDEHEKILSSVLQVERVQHRLFSDYFGTVKSLGGWGGDFILATGNEKTPEYFKSKGFETILAYDEMSL